MTDYTANTSLYIKKGNFYKVTNIDDLQVENVLPPYTFQIDINPITNEYSLEVIKSFVVPDKIYGDYMSKSERIVNTFIDRPASTGVLFTGEKGSGKSMLAKLISDICAKKHNMPTIVINSAHCGETFNAFIQSINQPCVVLFDEFEKVYNSDEQKTMLTLLDGIYPSKKLFILTCNEIHRVNEHMLNRPGRIYYSMHFSGMDEIQIREYCKCKLKNKTHTESIVKFSKFFGCFNFDVLQALVEEMNRYKESVAEAYKMLNANPNNDENKYRHYGVTLFSPENIELEIVYPTTLTGAPFQGADKNHEISICYEMKKKEHYAVFFNTDIVLEECINNRFVFKNKKGFKAIFELKQIPLRDYSLLI